jgi:hypothetical protein
MFDFFLFPLYRAGVVKNGVAIGAKIDAPMTRDFLAGGI